MPTAPTATRQSAASSLNLKTPLSFLTGFFLFFGLIGYQMGLPNMLSTIMSTAHDLLLNTAFFIMSLMVVTGALSSLLVEYKVIALMEKLLAPFMVILYNLPGRTALAGIMTFFSDNPAILSFAGDKKFASVFKPVQMASMTNFGTSFGMGFIVMAFMSSLNLGPDGGSPAGAAMIGMLAAILGSIISTRLMQFLCRNESFDQNQQVENASVAARHVADKTKTQQESTPFMRFMDAIMEGGRNGVQLGISIIPGILIITSIVFILTMGAPEGGYTGAAYEGVGLLAGLGETFSGFFYVLFGFESPELIAFPISTLGSTGASLSLIPPFIERGIITGNEIAVFTAIGMCWSGFLCTHACMLDTLGLRKLTGKAILTHTISGIAAGVIAHYLYLAF